MKPSSMPKLSSRILAIGARQLVVQEALETMRCWGPRMSSLTPITTMASISSFAGTVRMTFLAPAARCPANFSRERKTPVDSITTSTPSWPQGIAAGDFSSVIAILRPST